MPSRGLVEDIVYWIHLKLLLGLAWYIEGIVTNFSLKYS